MTGTSGIASTTKLEALEQVLLSATFARAEQLRRFLRYIGESEIEGRSASITEYSIGVEGLGRPADFVPSDDGIVRNRAHALRQKLLEYYAKENPEAEIHIELPKGAYIPRFYRAPTMEPSPTPVVPAAPATNDSSLRKWVGIGLAAAVLVGAAFFLGWRAGTPAPLNPVLAEAWGALANNNVDSLIVMELPKHLILREFPLGTSLRQGLPVDLPAPAETIPYYQGDNASTGVTGLRLQSAQAFRVGEVLGLVAVIKVLNHMGASYQILQSRAVSLAGMHGRNVILFGDPNLSPMIAKYLERGVFSIEFDKELRRFVIREKTQRQGDPLTLATRPKDSDQVGEYPGLLTVLPSEPTESSARKTVIFAGANSSGAQAAAEFFCSAQYMRQLKEKFISEGLDGFPSAYQVVVRGRAENQSLLSLSYVTHRVLARKTP